MRNKSIFAKTTALFLSAAIGTSMIGCQSNDQSMETGEQVQQDNSTETAANDSTTSDTQQKDYADSNGMGRYMEKIVFETDYVMGKIQLKLLSNGNPMFLEYLTDQRYQSKDGGDTWEKIEDGAFSKCVKEHYAMTSAISKEGVIAMIHMEPEEGQQDSEDIDYNYVLNIYNTDSTIKNISIPLSDSDNWINELTFGDDETLYVSINNGSVYEVDIDSGESKKLTDIPERAEVMSCRGNILMCAGYEKTYLYDLENGSLIEDEILNEFMKKNYGGVSWFGGGYTAYPFLGEDNSVYIAGEKGLYRHVINGNAMEQVIDGSLSAFGDPSHYIMTVIENDNQEFFAAFSDGKVVRFTYDATVSAVPSEKITIYSLKEDDMVKQAISAYRTAHPDMYIVYEVGMDSDSVTKEDALKKLNTKLLGSEGPDVLILDSMNIDTYADKGVLMDLSDIISEVDKTDGLYMNLIDPFYRDDKLFAVPLEFRIPLIGGRKDIIEPVTEYSSLADMIETARTNNPDSNLMAIGSNSGILKRFLPSCAPSWKTVDGQVNEEKIREFLQQTKRIIDAQMNGTPEDYIKRYQQALKEDASHEDDAYFMMIMDTVYMTGESPFMMGELIDAYTYLQILSIPKASGFEDTIYKRAGGQMDNIYHPTSIVGINTATKNPEQAKEILKLMLGTDVQDNPHAGLPINKKSMAKQFEYDETKLGDDGGLYYTSSTFKDTGKKISLVIYPAKQEDIKKLEDEIAKLNVPYLRDTVLEDAVLTEGEKYFNGSQDLDAAVKSIMNSVAIYMAE